MNKPPRLLLALAATGLASAAAADDGAPPVLANAALDALTPSTVLPSEAHPPAGSGGAADAPRWAEGGDGRPGEGLSRRPGLAEDGIGGGGGDASADASPSGAGPEGGASASAAGSVIGGSVSRSVVANAPGSAATASAAASGTGLSSVSVAARSGPGFSSSISRSTAVSSR